MIRKPQVQVSTLLFCKHDCKLRLLLHYNLVARKGNLIRCGFCNFSCFYARRIVFWVNLALKFSGSVLRLPSQRPCAATGLATLGLTPVLLQFDTFPLIIRFFQQGRPHLPVVKVKRERKDLTTLPSIKLFCVVRTRRRAIAKTFR